jgi:hypothetical protein
MLVFVRGLGSLYYDVGRSHPRSDDFSDSRHVISNAAAGVAATFAFMTAVLPDTFRRRFKYYVAGAVVGAYLPALTQAAAPVGWRHWERIRRLVTNAPAESVDGV